MTWLGLPERTRMIQKLTRFYICSPETEFLIFRIPP